MKKLLIAGIIISSMAFAKGNFNDFDMQKGNPDNAQMQNCPQGNENNLQNSKLTEAQQSDLLVLQKAHQKAIAPLRLAEQEKEILVKKELLADKPDWTKIETIIKDKSVIEAQIEVLMLKNRLEMQEKFGISFDVIGRGMGMNN